MSKKIIYAAIGVLLLTLVLGGEIALGQEPLITQVEIKVSPGFIAMPGNQVPKVPIGNARVRSTELRALNEKYHATEIEKVFEIKKVGGEEVKVEVPDTYIITLELEPEVSVQDVVAKYNALSVVGNATLNTENQEQ